MKHTHTLTRFKILQHVSGNFLCETIPDNWESMTEEEQSEFLDTNVWEPMEDKTVTDVWAIIDNSADMLIKFLINNGVVLK